MIVQLGALVGVGQKALDWVDAWVEKRQRIMAALPPLQDRPRVYFEEWDEPIITGIRWVSELMTLAGGVETFPENAAESLGKNRILADNDEVIRRAPDIIFGSWCGKKFRPERVKARPGWSAIPAVKDGQLYEIKSSIILQPGPAALTDGLDAMLRIIRSWQQLKGVKTA
jgi:iron complex transport system substrate-binding protein